MRDDLKAPKLMWDVKPAVEPELERAKKSLGNILLWLQANTNLNDEEIVAIMKGELIGADTESTTGPDLVEIQKPS